MNNAVRNIVIVGGGTAGWMCAAALSRLIKHSGVTVTLVESDDIGTVGVGEATIPSIRTFNALLGLNEDDFLRETQGTFKLGIEFVDWERLGGRYIHPFGTAGLDLNAIRYHQYWLKAKLSGRQVGQFEDHSLSAVAARNNRFARPSNDKSIHSTLNYAFHFDAGLYAKYLRRYSEGRGIRRLEGRIDRVHLRAEDGFIETVMLANGQQIKGELFIDCSGFRALLIGESLKVPYHDWKHFLPCDRALAIPCASTDDIKPFTRSTADRAGWRWRIPLQHRTGNGYVYSSEFISDDEARDSLTNNLDGPAQAEASAIHFITGRRDKFWVKNCVALGLASGFLEPLESTSIHLIQTGIARLLSLLPGRDFSQVEIEHYNRQSVLEFEQIRDFIILHYKATHRDDTPFWRHCRDMAIPDSLADKIELFKVRGRVFRSEDDLFTIDSWLAVMLGQGLMPRDYDTLVDSVDGLEAERFVRRVYDTVKHTAQDMPTHKSYIAACCAAVSPSPLQT